MFKKKAPWLLLFILWLSLACALKPTSSGTDPVGFGRLFVTTTPAPVPTPTPESIPLFHQAMKPEYAADIDQQLALGITRYQIDLLVVPESLTPPASPQLIGSVRVHYTNNESVLLNQVYFRLFPNTPNYGGAMTITAAFVDNQPVDTTLVADNSALFVPLHSALDSGESTEIVLTYQATIPTTTGAGNGLFAYDHDILTLAGFYPTIPVFDQVGWHLDLVPIFADTTYTDTSLYDVSLRVPAAMVVVTSGLIIENQPQNDGTTTLRAVSGPMRDFYISMSSTYQRLSREVEGTLIASYFPAGPQTNGQLTLDVGAEALAAYSRLFGPYPYREFNLVAAPMPEALGGMEFPGIVAMADRYYGGDNTFLEFVVAHEVAHQWWYGLVGSDQANAPWLDEALAQYSTVQYYEARYGPSRRQEIIDEMFIAPYRLYRDFSGDQSVLGTASSFSEASYQPIVYGKGPLFYEEVRIRLGDEAYLAALRAYLAGHRYGLTTPEDLLAAFEQAGGGGISDLYQYWIVGP